jgi:hypothetical protein
MTPPIEVEKYSTHSYYVDNDPNPANSITGYDWNIYGGNIQSGTGPFRIIKYSSPGNSQLYVRTKNVCGVGPWIIYDIKVESSSSPGGGDPIGGFGSANNNNNTPILNYQTVNTKKAISEFNEKITIYPNPAKTHVDINLIGDELTYINLINTNGQILKSISATDNARIDLNNFNNGLYIIQIKGNNYTETRKLIISR